MWALLPPVHALEQNLLQRISSSRPLGDGQQLSPASRARSQVGCHGCPAELQTRGNLKRRKPLYASIAVSFICLAQYASLASVLAWSLPVLFKNGRMP